MARTERGANGDLPLPHGRSRQHETRHVDACNQPQHTRGCKQRQQCRSDIAFHHRFAIGPHLYRCDIFAGTRIGILFRYLSLEDCQLRFGRMDAEAISHSSDDSIFGGCILDPAFVRLSELNRDPYLWLLWIERELEPARHDSDDGVRIAVQLDDLAENVRVSAESISPNGVTQHCHLGVTVAREFLIRILETATHRRFHSKGRKQVRADLGSVHLHWSEISLKKRSRFVVCVECDVLKAMTPLAPLLYIQERSAKHRRAFFASLFDFD